MSEEIVFSTNVHVRHRRNVETTLFIKKEHRVLSGGWIELTIRREDGKEAKFVNKLYEGGARVSVPVSFGFSDNDSVLVRMAPVRGLPKPPSPIAADQIDWSYFVPNGVLAVEVDGWLNIYAKQSEDFKIRRFTPINETAWLLGVYQADGGKKDLNGFTFTNRNFWILENFIRCLAYFGVTRRDLRALVKCKNNREDAARTYRNLYVPFRVEERAGADGERTCTLEWNRKAFLKMIVSAAADFLSGKIVQGRTEFLRGYLDGDGSITDASPYVLSSTGPLEEQEKIRDLINSVFPKVKAGHLDVRPSGNAAVYKRTLDLPDFVFLLENRFFSFSESYIRLLRGMEKSARAVFILRDGGQVNQGTKNLLRKHGIVDSDYRLTDETSRLLSVYDQHAARIAWANQQEITSKKCADHELAEAFLTKQVCYQKLVRSDEYEESLTGAVVQEIDAGIGREFIRKYEWLHDAGGCHTFYGLLSASGLLQAVVGFGSGPAPNLDRIVETSEAKAVCLERGARGPRSHPHASSYLISRAVKLMYKHYGYNTFYAYVDESAGERGVIYSACNWYCVGNGLGRDGKPLQIFATDDEIFSRRAVNGRKNGKRSVSYEGAVPAKWRYVWFEGSFSLKNHLKRHCKYELFRRKLS